jgi:hypothetical protein
MAVRFRPIHAPAAVVGYVIAAVASLWTINQGVARPVEAVLSAIALPLFFIFAPLYPALERFNLMAGELWRLPSTVGMMLATLLYAAIAYVTALALAKVRR